MFGALIRCRRCGGRILSFIAGLSVSVGAAANPQGAEVVHGSASFAMPNARTLEITNSPSAILNWQGFDIGAGETTRFIQESAASAVLNRVVSGNSSEILGNLVSNGRVFLINPAGILIGRDATVDTAGLVMSTLGIRDQDFLTGQLHFEDAGNAQGITNHGYIKTAPGGEIVLIAPHIVNETLPGNANSGLIESPAGELVLAAGHAITIASLDHPDITYDVRAPDNEAINLGRLIAQGGTVSILAGTLHHAGTINADALGRDDAGNIVLAASGTTYLDNGSSVSASASAGNAGTIEVSGERVYALGAIAANGDRGGHISLSGDRILATGSTRAHGAIAGGRVSLEADIEVIATASAGVDASGDRGTGGTVHIDGGEGTFSSALVTATGTTGGTIEVLGDEVTLAAATIDASGTARGGKVRVGGGFQGGEGLRAAQLTEVNAATVIKADAEDSGNGGSVVVWADDTTTFSGTISATGGDGGGDGGQVEVSGKQRLAFTGLVDVTALNGDAGSLLLDPQNIIFTNDTQGAGGFQILDPHPGANNGFGQRFGFFYENGDFSTPAKMVVYDDFDDFGGADAGAVYLYRMSDGALLSALTGSHAGDRVGVSSLQNVGGTQVLSNSLWNASRGAVTAYDVVNGTSGVVGTANSLVGANAGDQIGSAGVQNLFGSSAIVVRSPNFNGLRGALTVAQPNQLRGVVGSDNSLVGANLNDQVGANSLTSFFNGRAVLASNHGGLGAVTFINAASRPTGVVSAANSLVGSSTGDNVGGNGVQQIGSFYAVRSADFNGTAGAVTIGSITTGIEGAVGAGNSLIGGTAGDLVGANSLTNLFTGEYALVSDMNGFGAVTVFAPGAPPLGVVSAANSLIGGSATDAVGSGGLQSLGSSTWAVLSPDWANGAATNAGAVTMLNASNGTFAGTANAFKGTVSAANSLVGVSSDDAVGSDGIEFFAVGSRHAILSPRFDNVGAGASDSGAVTWYLPGDALSGVVSTANSLLGANDNDDVGGSSNNYEFLFSGNGLLYVPDFDSGAGALVFVDASAPLTGTIGAANALVGAPGDMLGSGGIEVTFDYYAVLSPEWANGSSTSAGAVTIASDTTGVVGLVDNTNSLVGVNTNDRVGSGGMWELNSGNAVVFSPDFNGNAGAVTFLDLGAGHLIGDTDFAADLSSSNSLVGQSAGDAIGSAGIEIADDHYIVLSPLFGTSFEGGAVTVADDVAGVAGVVGVANSLLGGNAFDHVGSGGIQILANGNALVISPDWNSIAGAVTYLDLLGGSLIGDSDFAATVSASNSLIGATPGDAIGSDGVVEFFAGSNRYYAVFSGAFANGGANAGAVSFADATVGLAGVVSNSNSFVGTSANDAVGDGGSYDVLSSGNVIFFSTQWNGTAGAATFVDLVGGTGLVGDIGTANSVTGSAAGDLVGSGGVTEVFGTDLYAIHSPQWANGAAAQAGALTWGNISSGGSGTVALGNSLVGSTTGDNPGSNGISTVSTAGGTRVVVSSSLWDNGAATNAGAITTFLASTPKSGAIDATNSLVGSNANDRVGSGFTRVLSNGNRVLGTTSWNNNRGAVTFWNTSGDLTGTVGASNSLIGSTDGDFVGTSSGNVIEVGAGRYYVASPNWDNGAADQAGALTFGSITSGVKGAVSEANSLVGTSTGDRVGEDVRTLSSGRLLVLSDDWNAQRGAVTVINPSAPRVGAISAANSLVGSSAGDRAGDFVQFLFQGDNSGLVVLRSNTWNNNAGHVTVFNPLTPIVGTVGAANSLIGRTGDNVGSGGVSELANGSLLVRSPLWSNGTGANFGAATFMRAASPVTAVKGFVSASNSLVGSHANDQVGSGSFNTLSTGNILLRSPSWFDNRGAVTFINIGEGRTGTVSGANSLVGELANDFLGSGGIIPLGGDRALVRSPLASINGIAGAGRLDVIDGSTVQSISGDIGFDSNPGGELAISIASVVGFLNGGGTLLLQATNDIRLPVGASIFAERGILKLQAGRSIDIESDLVVLEGEIALLANAPGGSASSFREAGDGNITLTAGDKGVRILATTLSLEAQNIFLNGGTTPNAYAAAIGLGTTSIHAHGSGLLSLTGGTAPGSTFTPGSSADILTRYVNDPASITSPAAFVVGFEGLSIIADDIQLTGGGSTGAFAALASFGEFTVDSINIVLEQGSADFTGALLLGLGGLADINFVNCSGCDELEFDPLFDSFTRSGIHISGLFREPAIDAILAMLDRDEDDDDEDEESDTVRECN